MKPLSEAPPRPPGPLDLEGVPVHPFTVDSLHAFLGAAVEGGHRVRVHHVNVHAMNLARRLPDFCRCLQTADAVYCDGEGVRLGARLRGVCPPPERITLAEWMWKLAPWAAERGYAFYFLGARPGVAERAAKRIAARVKGFELAGALDGYFHERGTDDEEVVARINASGAALLIVGMGMPRQERWLARHRDALDVPVAITGGACFDFLSGDVARCPGWMARLGLEWLFRLLREPRRLFRRYVLGNPWFVARMVAARLRRGAPSVG